MLSPKKKMIAVSLQRNYAVLLLKISLVLNIAANYKMVAENTNMNDKSTHEIIYNI